VRHTPVAQAPVGKAPVLKPPLDNARDRQSAQDGEDKILFQDYFKSIGPRTYASQLKEAKNGNHYLVITEGKRDKDSGEVRKTRVFIYSEDFSSFFKMLSNTAGFIREHPVPDDVKKKRAKYWAKHAGENPAPAAPPAVAPNKPAPVAKMIPTAKPMVRPAPRPMVRSKK
jgi:hypothetical protein